MKLFRMSVAAVLLMAASARAEEVQVAAIAPLVKDARTVEMHKAAKPAKPAAKKAQRKHRDLTPAEWQLENPQLG
ncbi:MAG: hypothetical protein ABR567_01405 [Myxococcales bacterium]|nr:hypothetical protein [Myxococcales bacterium]